MSSLSRRQSMILATLLVADGEVVSYGDLCDVVGTPGWNESEVIRQYAARIRALGIDCVETVTRRWLRLTGVPPDWALPDILGVLDSMRRQGIEIPEHSWRKAS